jgi:hypothetical protein
MTFLVVQLFETEIIWPEVPFYFFSENEQDDILAVPRPNPNKHGVWEPMPELTIYVHSKTFTIGNNLPESTFNPMAESALSPRQGLRIWPLLNFPYKISFDRKPFTPFYSSFYAHMQ